MGNCFKVEIPSDYSPDEKRSLIERIHQGSCLVFNWPLCFKKNEIEFLTEKNDKTVSSIQKEFKIPESFTIIDTSHWDHS
ncbi:hypothetical protein [Pectinatus frisingensis]|uniref:hypothetical protein n=1 Tax=Pectinatus frisingensis TaxID=865 RepID=UPI0018C51AC0|nr:hypothetical protein [Pectinatus frisingensis]